MPGIIQPLFGAVVILAIAVAFSNNRRAINWTTVAWGLGLLGGPALSGFLFERMGFGWLMLIWAPPLVSVAWLLGRVQSPLPPVEEHA